MLSAIVFDMDGVLLDTHPLHVRNWRTIFLEAGHEITKSDLEVLIEGATREEILRRTLGELSESQKKHYCFRKEELFREGEHAICLIPGVSGFLEAVEQAAIPKAVATSASRARTERLLECFGLKHRFTTIVTGETTAKGKGSPHIFRAVLQRLNVRASECLVIEDSPIAVRSAVQLDMPVVAIAPEKSAAEMSEAGASLVVADFRGLTLRHIRETLISAGK